MSAGDELPSVLSGVSMGLPQAIAKAVIEIMIPVRIVSLRAVETRRREILRALGMLIAHMRFLDMELLRLRPDQVHFPSGCLVCGRPPAEERVAVGAQLHAPLCNRCWYERYSMQTFGVMSLGCLALTLPIALVLPLANALALLVPFVFASAGALRWLLQTRRWRRRVRVRLAGENVELALADPRLAHDLLQAAQDDYRGARPIERSMVRPPRGSCRR